MTGLECKGVTIFAPLLAGGQAMKVAVSVDVPGADPWELTVSSKPI
jgi:hypothetical protein